MAFIFDNGEPKNFVATITMIEETLRSLVGNLKFNHEVHRINRMFSSSTLLILGTNDFPLEVQISYDKASIVEDHILLLNAFSPEYSFVDGKFLFKIIAVNQASFSIPYFNANTTNKHLSTTVSYIKEILSNDDSCIVMGCTPNVKLWTSNTKLISDSNRNSIAMLREREVVVAARLHSVDTTRVIFSCDLYND